jgi:hypothetical protein
VNTGLQPAAWHDLYVTLGTGSAALLGLFFVAISLHPREIENHPILRNRARINFQALSVILAISLAVLIPGQDDRWLGSELVALAIGYLLLLVGDVSSTRRAIGGLTRVVWFRLAAAFPGGFLFLVAGISLIVGRGPGLFIAAPAALFSLPLITFMAWNLLFATELKGRHDDRPSNR